MEGKQIVIAIPMKSDWVILRVFLKLHRACSDWVILADGGGVYALSLLHLLFVARMP
jgi:hypothetical protein